MLREAKLSFTPMALFTLGSPLGAYLSIAEEVPLLSSFALPRGTRLLNVLHPIDPLAYRMEPLLALEFEQQPPEQVPHCQTPLAKRLASHSVKGVTLALNAGARVDWLLQDKPERPDESPKGEVAGALLLRVTRRGRLRAGCFCLFGHLGHRWLPGRCLLCRGFLVVWKRHGARGSIGAAPPAAAFEASAAAVASGVAGAVSRKCKDSGATDIVLGTYHAATGVVGAARAVGGTVRLVGNVVGSAGNAVAIARAAAASAASQKK
ncbi:unnamed protein product [Polarella glacialis]|uniref:DDHD domain-containing protein n=1 Tax=Polarella glacialis TaxID=89957 RepID=A0A813KCW7_POLGL|nr:unnamed protein product [Polarella glacialis]